ncbi:MAG: hypothetical protein P8J01_08800 [Acidimicrobiales bacterium]|nr:hypothetical protein [Acidimicrobiales bacterium]
MISKFAFLPVVAGIGWEPEIRGALTVLISSLVLFGSIWLILNTNLGNRLGTLIAITGFFGWMVIMGIVWWIYGIGLQGDRPTWQPTEIIFGDPSASESDIAELGANNIDTVSATSLVSIYCPGLVDATAAVQLQREEQNNTDLLLDYDSPKLYCTESMGEKLAVDEATIAAELRADNERLSQDAQENGVSDSRILSQTALEVKIDRTIEDQKSKVSQLTLSDLKSISPDIIDDARDDGILNFNSWNLLSSGAAGEAIATADAYLVSSSASPFVGGSSEEFFVLDSFQKGGKPKRNSDGLVDRVWNEIRNTIVFWHPTNTVVVTVNPTLDKELIAGEAPPFSEIDPKGQPVSVVMERNLGSLRLPAALTTIGSAFAFFGLSFMLHQRDRELRRRTEEWDRSSAS